MSDRADELARQFIKENANNFGEYGLLVSAIAAILRTRADEARQEEQDALKQWAKDRCGHCQIAAEDFVADRSAVIRARVEKTIAASPDLPSTDTRVKDLVPRATTVDDFEARDLVHQEKREMSEQVVRDVAYWRKRAETAEALATWQERLIGELETTIAKEGRPHDAETIEFQRVHGAAAQADRDVAHWRRRAEHAEARLAQLEGRDER